MKNQNLHNKYNLLYQSEKDTRVLNQNHFLYDFCQWLSKAKSTYGGHHYSSEISGPFGLLE